MFRQPGWTTDSKALQFERLEDLVEVFATVHHLHCDSHGAEKPKVDPCIATAYDNILAVVHDHVTGGFARAFRHMREWTT